jgi:flagellar basal body-associated protein FliL
MTEQMTEPKRGMSRGCLITLIIVSVLLILVIAMSIVCYVKRDSIFQWSLVQVAEQAEKEMVSDLPDSVTADDLHKLISDFKTAVKEKKVDQQEMQKIVFLYQEIWDDKKIDKDEAKKFLDELKKAIGQETPLIEPE